MDGSDTDLTESDNCRSGYYARLVMFKLSQGIHMTMQILMGDCVVQHGSATSESLEAIL